MISVRHANFLSSTILIKLLILCIGFLTLLTFLRYKNGSIELDGDTRITTFGEIQDLELGGNKIDIHSKVADDQQFQPNHVENNPKLADNQQNHVENNHPLIIKEKPKNLLINPMDITKPLPRAKECVKDVDGFLTKLRNIQRESLEYWRQMSVNNLVKWSALTSVYDPEQFNFRLLYNFVSDGENKYFLEFVKRDNPNCEILTLGVGLDFDGEIKLWNRYPQCKMTAVDPLSEVNKEIVEQVPSARFIEATIGSHDGTYLARLRQANGRYKTVTVKHVGITKFLQQTYGEKTIDLLIMDIEGGEFGVLPLLIDDKHVLPKICQINFELHFPPESYNYTTTEALNGIHKFFADGTYSIMNMEIFRRFHRIFAVNTVDQECIKKFLC